MDVDDCWIMGWNGMGWGEDGGGGWEGVGGGGLAHDHEGHGGGSVSSAGREGREADFATILALRESTVSSWMGWWNTICNIHGGIYMVVEVMVEVMVEVVEVVINTNINIIHPNNINNINIIHPNKRNTNSHTPTLPHSYTPTH